MPLSKETAWSPKMFSGSFCPGLWGSLGLGSVALCAACSCSSVDWHCGPIRCSLLWTCCSCCSCLTGLGSGARTFCVPLRLETCTCTCTSEQQGQDGDQISLNWPRAAMWPTPWGLQKTSTALRPAGRTWWHRKIRHSESEKRTHRY